MSHVFISYKHTNGDFAQILASKIESDGFEVWKDDDDDKLPAGSNWRDKIDQAIKDAFAMIVIMTPEAKSSEYIIYECGFAHGAGVAVIPIILEPTKIHPRLDVLQHLDFTTSDRRARPWHLLTKALKQYAAVYEERKIDCDRDIPALINALHEINKDMTNHTIKVLAKTGMPAVGYLLKALCDNDVRVRRSAAVALGEIRDSVAVQGLLAALYDMDEHVRNCAASALGLIGIPSISGLVKVLTDYERDEKVRADVALALGQTGGFEAVCGLLEALQNDKAKTVRFYAAMALGQIGHTYAISSLVNTLLYDKEKDVRLRAVKSLGQIDHPTAILGLRDALNTEKEEEIRDTISQVVEHLESNTSTS